MRNILDVAVKAAVEAGKYLKESEFVIESLSGKDIKMAQDKESEKIIKDILLSGSDFDFLGEESGIDKARTESDLWIVDPLDGTMNYSRKVPISCVSIALWRSDSPLLGVIYDFNREEMFTAIVGEGAWVNDNPFEKYVPKARHQSILATGFTSYMSYDNESIGVLLERVKEYKKIRMIGSAALSLAYVASGRFDSYIEKDIKIWDVAAGLALIKSAGIPAEYSFTDDKYSMDVHCGV